MHITEDSKKVNLNLLLFFTLKKITIMSGKLSHDLKIFNISFSFTEKGMSPYSDELLISSQSSYIQHLLAKL